ncbi:MAG: PSD1 domain-containing protein [Cyclobacteriaceae bacterium]|nr:PSD1 domain-containing protein [Cyclobacteriaceae bacterium SS2]
MIDKQKEKSLLSLWACLSVILLFTSCVSDDRGLSHERKIPEEVDYNFHVRPILSDNCFACHGPDVKARQANLRLDTEEGAFSALAEYEHAYPFVKGKPEESLAFLKMTSTDSGEMMPPPGSNLRLSDYEIRVIEKWIRQGADYKPHWAFIPPQKPKIPLVKNEDWTRNEIDYFVLQKLEEQKLTPNETATKQQLLKRVSFDLTGLPPSLDMQEAFLKDDSDNAYSKVVDQLLASKHYGEKMALHWLDIARYADSHGYQNDGFRTMWPWRDWIIHAFNENYSYEKLITWQLAGDLLPGDNLEALLATGFNRNHKITQEGGAIDEEYRMEYVSDRTDTFGKAFLGLTMECAKCHDHKYDPISTEEYYSTSAFFDKIPEKGLAGGLGVIFADAPKITITPQIKEEILTFINNRDTGSVEVMVMADSAGIRQTHILERGVYDAKGKVVDYATPKAVLPFDSTQYAKDRLGLSKWLLSDSNPLTARVFVNRIWMEFFTQGIVKTVGDFGMQGDLPTHPELLDWLAVDFRENGWDIKRMVKQIVTSSTYMQSAVIQENKLKKDPENIYLSRMHRSRFKAEFIRDMVLASSGLLNEEIGGPSVRPYQPAEMWEVASSGRGSLRKYVQDHGDQLYRRGIYTFIKRTVPPPVMLTFDSSPRDHCEEKRQSTNTPLQALIMLNDPTVLEASRVLAEKIDAEDLTDEENIKKASRLIICRDLKEKELELLLGYLNDSRELFESDPEKAQKFINVGEYPANEDRDIVSVAALMQVIHTIYNMEEAIMKS